MKRRRVALLHYSASPVVGGVESVLEQQARGLRHQGHEAVIFCGRGKAEPGCREIQPLLSTQSNWEAAPAQPSYAQEVGNVLNVLTNSLRSFDAVVIHNLLTMPFHPALTQALWELPGTLPQVRWVNWIHDLAAINPDYSLPSEPRPPWSLLRNACPGMVHVTVSPQRARQFSELTGHTNCHVIPNGINFAALSGASPALARWLETRWLPGSGPALLHPTRILRRKNVELTLRTTAAIKAHGLEPLTMITAAEDPHQAKGHTLLHKLRELRGELQLESNLYFMGEDLTLSDADLRALYLVADLVFFPSRQEGFGLPVLEAGWLRTPLFCSEIEPHQWLAGETTEWFPPDTDPAELASRMVRAWKQNPTLQHRRQLRERFDFRERILPELEQVLFGANQPTA